jgi:small subunit ribosomal protein S18
MARFKRSKGGRRRRKGRGRDQGKCRFGGDPSKIDYKDINLLSKMTTSQGKLFSRKRAGTSACCQRALSKALKRARFMALMPYAG